MRSKRHGVRRTLWRAMQQPVSPRQAGMMRFVWLLILLFAVQIVTGILLSLYYQPSPESAYESVVFILRDVSFGWLLRGVHYWSAQLMIALGMLQVIRAFYAGMYKGPGRIHWYIGMLLFLSILAFALTGSLLAWDQTAYWGAVGAMEWVEAIPVVGTMMALVLRGGHQVGAATLGRFYSIHILLLPWITFYLLLAHLWLQSRIRAEQVPMTPKEK